MQQGISCGQVCWTGAVVIRSVTLRNSAGKAGNGNGCRSCTPTTDTVPPARTAVRASDIVTSEPTASITASTPRPPLSSIAATVVDSSARSDPHRYRPLASLLYRVDAENRCRTEQQRAARRAQPHCPQPDHGHRPSDRYVGAQRRRPSGGEVVGEQQRFLVAEPVGYGAS